MSEPVHRIRVRVYLRSGQVLKLKGVEDFVVKGMPITEVKWKVKSRGFKPLSIDPGEIVAVTYKR